MGPSPAPGPAAGHCSPPSPPASSPAAWEGGGSWFCFATSPGSHCNKLRCTQRAGTDMAHAAGSPGACRGTARSIAARVCDVTPVAPTPAIANLGTSKPTKAPLLAAASPPIAPRLHNSPPWGSSRSAPARADSAPDAAGTPRWPEQSQRKQGKHRWVWEHLPIEFCFTNEHGAEVTVHLLA